METKNINIWDTKFKDKCIFIKNIEQLINYIKENNTISPTIHEKHNPNEPQKCLFDYTSNKNNISITYTNEEYPVTIINWEGIEHNALINPKFFNQHKKKIKEEYTKILLEQIKENPHNLKIPDFLINDEIINLICSSENLKETYINFYEVTGEKLTEEQIKKIKKEHLDVNENGNKISSKYVIPNYTIKSLKETNKISLKETLKIDEIENFIYVNDNCQIYLNKDSDNIDEIKYLNNLTKIFQILSKHNKTYNIQIEINNRELLKQSGILNYNNINLSIKNDLYEYPKEEYLKEEKQLEEIIKPIKEANLSPYEKYIAVYNIVKNFKPYKENPENKEESRYLRYILNNEYIVCVGYANLLTTLLDKVGIPSKKFSVGIDTSYDKGFTKDNTPTNKNGHARNIVKIDDDKYNIHGYFVADATWDNDSEIDLYNNLSMTFNRKKEAHRLETLTAEDLLLDFNNLDDFSQKINFYLKRKINKPIFNEKKYSKKVINAYKSLYEEVQEILSILDYPKYKEFYDKYNIMIKKINNFAYIKDISLDEIEEMFGNFLTDYAKYILPITNKKIDKNTLLNAIINVKKEIDKCTQEESNELKSKIEETHNKIEHLVFPYIYNPDYQIPNYLESREEASKKR